MSKNSIENILKLYSVPSVGSYKTRQLISVFGTAEEALSASTRQLQIVPGIGPKISKTLKNEIDLAFVERQLNAEKKGQHKIISFWDNGYPELLKNIYDPPILLFYLGDLSILNKMALAVVGTRDMTDYGMRALDTLIKPLKGWDITIVSGMARGVDSYTHKLCLDNKISTVGVLGHGLERIYPPENIQIWKRMINENLILSEYPIGTEIDPRNFPRRNRIISGLSQGTLVVQARSKSGALISADYATEQNRDVLAVPCPINEEQSEGVNRLISDGAIPVYNSEILQNWFGTQKAPTKIDDMDENILNDLEESQADIWSKLSFNPLHIDQVAFNCQLSTRVVLGKLLELELSGLVRQLPGKMFVRAQ